MHKTQLRRTQAGPGRAVQLQQEHTSPNLEHHNKVDICIGRAPTYVDCMGGNLSRVRPLLLTLIIFLATVVSCRKSRRSLVGRHPGWPKNRRTQGAREQHTTLRLSSSSSRPRLGKLISFWISEKTMTRMKTMNQMRQTQLYLLFYLFDGSG